MASPRKRWVKQPTSLLREPWPIEVKGALVMLSCWLGDRWARDGIETFDLASRATLSRGAVQEVTGRRTFVGGVSLLRQCTAVVTLEITEHPSHVEIWWPKWAKVQEDASRSPGSRRPVNAPSKTQTQKKTQTQTQEEKNAPSALVTEAEGDVMDAFRLHGKNLRSSAARRKLIATRLREYTAADLANAVHGYQYTHRQGSNGEFDPAKHFRPETIFRASKIDGYIEAAAEAHGLGLTPPFKPDRVLSKNERVMKDFFENDTSPLNPLAGLGEPKRWT